MIQSTLGSLSQAFDRRLEVKFPRVAVRLWRTLELKRFRELRYGIIGWAWGYFAWSHLPSKKPFLFLNEVEFIFPSGCVTRLELTHLSDHFPSDYAPIPKKQRLVRLTWSPIREAGDDEDVRLFNQIDATRSLSVVSDWPTFVYNHATNQSWNICHSK